MKPVDSFDIMRLKDEITRLQARIIKLEKQISDMGWQLNPDRMGR